MQTVVSYPNSTTSGRRRTKELYTYPFGRVTQEAEGLLKFFRIHRAGSVSVEELEALTQIGALLLGQLGPHRFAVFAEPAGSEGSEGSMGSAGE